MSNNIIGVNIMKINDYLKSKKNIMFIIIFTLCIVIIIISRLYSSQSGEIYTAGENIDMLQNKENIKDDADIIVHIAGEVANPGIVKISNGQRLYEAIEKAGGATNNADLNEINLAMILEDGQKIIIPSIAVNSNNSGIKDDRININIADKETLMELPGIGETLSQNIIDYREKNSGFKNIDDIKNVPKIGDITFERLKDLIKAE